MIETNITGDIFSASEVVELCEAKLSGYVQQNDINSLQDDINSLQDHVANLAQELQISHDKLVDIVIQNESLQQQLCASQQSASDLGELRVQHKDALQALSDQKANAIQMIDNSIAPFREALQNMISEDQAVIIGLSARPSLNGQVVDLVQWHDDKQRWQVKTSDESSLLVKAINLLQSDNEDLIELFGHPIYDG